MTRRFYSNTSAPASAAVQVGAGDTSLALADFSGFPAAPFIAAIDKDSEDEEIVLVTEVLGSTVVVTRGYDGTLAKAHSAGASFRHVASAKDFDEPNAHVNATGDVHGITGDVVGTTDAQTLTNKTLFEPTISSPTFTGTASGVSADFSGTVAATTVSGVTLDISGNGTVDGTLTVTGPVTLLGTLAAEAAELASAAVSGNVTVGGTLGVTGTLSGASAGFTGTVTAGTSSATTAVADEIELDQAAADPSATTAGHTSVWAAADAGLWIRGAGQSARRIPNHWGSVSSYPADAIPGDTCFHTALNSALMVFRGVAWQQLDGPLPVANMAARPGVTSALSQGFKVYDVSTDREYTWDGSWWRTDGTAGHTPPGATTGDYITAIADIASFETSSVVGGGNINFGHTFSQKPEFVLLTTGSTASGDVAGATIAHVLQHTTSAIAVRVLKATGGPLTSTVVRVNYLVIGRNN